MSDANRTSAEIERDIQREREELQSTLNEIRDRYSVEAMARQAGRALQDHGGDIGRSVMRQVKENPVPLALTAIGIAWMMSGRSGRVPEWHSANRRYSAYDERYGAYGNDDRHDGGVGRDYRDYGYPEGADLLGADADSGGWEAGYRTDRTPSTGATSAHAGASGSHRSASERLREAREAASERWETTLEGAEQRWRGARSRSSSAWRSGRHSVASGWSGVRDAILGGWRSASHASGSYARGARASASELRDRLHEGTAEMSEEARKRVVAARQAAHDAQVKLEEAWERSSRQAGEMFESQPLVAGALALAAGAALGSLLPRTAMEDEAMGDESDRLFEEANRIYREERGKVARVAKAAADEASAVVREKRGEYSQAASEQARHAADDLREAVDRVSDRARKEAGKEHLGEDLGGGSRSQ